MLNVDYGGHGGDLAAAALQFGRPPHTFIDFSSNINPLGPPPGLIAHLQRQMDQVARYPQPGAALLRRGLAQRFNLPEERLLVGNGASDLIHLLFLYLRPKKVLLPVPTFSEYARAACLAGASVETLLFWEQADPALRAVISRLQGVDLLVLCNPNNPIGSYYSPEVMEELLLAAKRRGVTVLVDESFQPLAGLPPGQSAAATGLDNLFVVTSLTKIWALPGLRLGFLAGPGAAIKKLTACGDPWRVNSLAQLAGLYCLQHPEHEAKAVAEVNRERSFLQERLAALPGLTVFPGEANYLLLRGERNGFAAALLYRYLGQKGILIRMAENFPGLDRRYFRIAVRTRRENLLLLEALGEYFSTEQKEAHP